MNDVSNEEKDKCTIDAIYEAMCKCEVCECDPCECDDKKFKVSKEIGEA